MAEIIPFRAVRPAADKVALVTTRPYDEYSAAELASWLDFNPFSFLHIINPAFINQQKIDPTKRYEMVANKYRDFKNNGIFLKEDKPCFYLYEIQCMQHTFTGIIAGTSLDDYKNQIIKKHESTLEYRVENLKDYLKQAKFNTEPVLMMYPQNDDLHEFTEQKKSGKPLYDFSTTNRERHIIWKIDNENEIQWIIHQFSKINTLYIADGHHRTTTSQLLCDEMGNRAEQSMKYFMSYLICENNIKINEYNRVVHDLNGYTDAEFLDILKNDFEVTKVHEYWRPTKKYSFGMYLNNQFYALNLKNIPQDGEILAQLDPQILYDHILNPVLGIGDLRTDSRISYIAGNRSLVDLKDLIDYDGYKVGFILYPSTVSEIKSLAENNLTMPPKSTYIEPKFRNGLFIYEI